MQTYTRHNTRLLIFVHALQRVCHAWKWLRVISRKSFSIACRRVVQNVTHEHEVVDVKTSYKKQVLQ
jgi:hypothetical protein